MSTYDVGEPARSASNCVSCLDCPYTARYTCRLPMRFDLGMGALIVLNTAVMSLQATLETQRAGRRGGRESEHREHSQECCATFRSSTSAGSSGVPGNGRHPAPSEAGSSLVTGQVFQHPRARPLSWARGLGSMA